MENNRKFLIYDGYRYGKNRESIDKIYWKCACYGKYKCAARATTKTIGGYEMVRVNYKEHNHPPRIYY